MKLFIKYLSYTVLLLFFANCETEIPYEIDHAEKKLTINGVLRSDTTISLKITSSTSVLDATGIQILKDVTVKLFEDNVYKETLKYNNTNGYQDDQPYQHQQDVYYESKLKPSPGKTDRIEASMNGFPTADATIQMPPSPTIIKVDTLRILKNVEDNFQYFNAQYEIKLQFSDDAQTSNYYSINGSNRFVGYNKIEIIDTINRVYKIVDSTDRILSPELMIPIYSNDNLIEKDISEQFNYRLYFSDLLFNGNKTTIAYNLPFNTELINYYHVQDIPKYLIFIAKLSAISEDYYKYLKSVVKYKDAESNPLAEKVHIKSNVNNGYGIVGAQSVSKYEFKVPYRWITVK